MKNTLSILLFLSFSSFLFGQFHPVNSKYLAKKNIESTSMDGDSSVYKAHSLHDIILSENSSKMLDRYYIGKSGNAHSIVHSEQRRVFYDKSTENFMFIFPADIATYPEALSNNSIVSVQTHMNDWSDWETQICLNPDPALHLPAFPSAVIYNPEESQNIDDTHVVLAGIDMVGDSWTNNFFASAKFDGSEQSVFYKAMASENDWARSSMTLINNDVFIFGQDFQNINGYGANQTLKHYVGTTDDPANGFEWEINAVSPDWLMNESDAYAYALYTTWSAWKKDGSIGYMWMVGVTNESYNYGVYQPQVFFTVDHGETWEYIELNFEDNPVLTDILPPWQDANGNSGTVRPSFLTADRNFPGAVDYRGYLNLYSNVYGSTTGDVLNPDEGNWINEDSKGGYIFNFVISPDGLADVLFMDSIISEVVIDSAFGDMGWTHRLQTTKTRNELTTYIVWTDDRESSDGYLNNPDIYAAGYCTVNGLDDVISTRNLTEGDLYEGFYFYPFVAEYSSDYNGYYDIWIPMTSSITPSEWVDNDSDQPISHHFITDATIRGGCINSVSENVSDSQLFVSQNAPNPVKGCTSIDIAYSKVLPVSISVYNLLGQTIYTQDLGLLYSKMTINLDLTEDGSGLYFYTVKVGEKSITRKLLVN